MELEMQFVQILDLSIHVHFKAYSSNYIYNKMSSGNQVRMMKSDASIWKNQKTLVWKREGPKTFDEFKWKRWDIIIHGPNPSLMKWNPDIVILTDDLKASHAWLKTKAASQVRFILISSALVDAIEIVQPFASLGLGNVMCLEELTTMYPFLGSPWSGSIEDAIMNAVVIFRYMRIVGIQKEIVQPRLNQLQVDVSLRIDLNSLPPESLTLIQQYYVPPQAKRAKELYTCLKANLECPFVDTIILCVEPNVKKDSLPPDPHGKLKLTPLNTRITYADCIRIIEKNVPKGHIVVFANADIYLDMSWHSIWSTDLHDVFLALLRWEQGSIGQEPKLFGPRPDSQDTWVIHSDSVLSRSWDYEALNIPFGKAGCDNAILVEFLRQKFKIVNPALSLHTIHVHQSEIRTYNKTDTVNRPVYMHVDPTGIHELNPIVSFETWAPRLVEHGEPLKRPLRATTEKMLATFCSQMNRESPIVWASKSTNDYTMPLNQDHHIDCSGGVFVSPNGLVYGYTDLFVGTTDIQKDMWSKNALSHLIPAQPTDTMMAFPLESKWLDDPALYTLYYLSRVLKQHDLTPEASFWSTMETMVLLSPIKLFRWTTLENRLIQYSEDTQVFAKRAVGRTAHSVRLMPTDINSLRSSLSTEWVSQPISEPILVVVLDKDETMPSINKEGYTVRTIRDDAKAHVWASSLSGASRIIIKTSMAESAWAWLWLAPAGCKVLEIQEDRIPSDSLLHLSAAAGLEWTLLQYYRSTAEGFKTHVLAEVEKWFADKNAHDKAVAQSLPLVIVPPKTMKFGFYGHKGDSFRELVELWHETNLVQRVEDPSAVHCWLHAVGDTLLYDRDTWDWLEKDLIYKKCLTGNAEPSLQKAAQPWIFWPRHPRLVEEIASSGLKPISDRTDSVVFFGRIENPEQGVYRKDVDAWRALCSKFIMPVGAKQPYPLGPEDYLKALQGSKYGLCLRGYDTVNGTKCNREIELLAMGTVPLVTPGVDYTNYIEPLIDGIHVLCVKDADDARAKMAAVSDQQLETMSKAGYLWWKRNASVKGSWSRTWAAII